MQRKQTYRAMLIEHRDWLLEKVIPGYQRRHDEESIKRAVAQLHEIEGKLGGLRHGKGKASNADLHRD